MLVKIGETCFGPERRIDPENRMGLDFHAARALTRFQHITEPEAMRAAITSADFRNTGAHEGEAEKMRDHLIAWLNKIENRRTPEQERFLKLLEAQIPTAVNVWTERFPIEDAPDKTRLEQECQKWLSGLPPEILQGFLELCPKTTELVVVPPLAAPKLLSIINAHKTIPRQTDSEIRRDGVRDWDMVISDKWKFGLANGAEDISFDPAIYFENPDAPEAKRVARTNGQMVDKYEQLFRAKGLQLMPRYGYVPSYAKVLAQRRVLDRHFFTMFRGLSHAVPLLRGGFGDDDVYLGEAEHDSSYKGLRCRPWVEGEMSD